MGENGPDHRPESSTSTQDTITSSASKPVSWQHFFDLVGRSEIPLDFMAPREVLPADIERLISGFDEEILDWK